MPLPGENRTLTLAAFCLLEGQVTFSVGTITRCPGQNHYFVPITVSGVTKTIVIDQSELATDFASLDDARERVIDRLRSARKEAGAGNFAQTKTALEGKSYQL